MLSASLSCACVFCSCPLADTYCSFDKHTAHPSNRLTKIHSPLNILEIYTLRSDLVAGTVDFYPSVTVICVQA